MAATQTELAAQMRELKTQMAGVGADVDTAVAEIQKVGTETDGLKQKIVDLEAALANQTGVSPEVTEAFNALKEQLGAVQTSVASAKTAIQTVDDKVPDTTPPPPPPA